MKKLRFTLAAALCAAVLFPALSYAQTGLAFDHLKCYKIKDSIKAKYVTDLVPLQDPPFNVEPGCVVNVPAKLFCIPVDKTNVKPAPPLAVNGKDAQDYLVYKIKCPKATGLLATKGGMSLPVTDQFGARKILVGAHQVLLVPAFKQDRLCHAQNDPVAPLCGGDCTDPSQKCTQIPGTTQCACESPCGVDAAGQCGGTCPYDTQKCQVKSDATGALVCTCDPFVNGCSLDTNRQCGGPCPGADEKCVNDASTGSCQCEKPCGSTGIRMCGGLCQNPSDSCQMKPDDSGCECHPQTTTKPCGPDAVGQCGGICPNNLPCVKGGLATGNGCICG
jgi:hypothetical protein